MGSIGCFRNTVTTSYALVSAHVRPPVLPIAHPSSALQRVDDNPRHGHELTVSYPLLAVYDVLLVVNPISLVKHFHWGAISRHNPRDPAVLFGIWHQRPATAVPNVIEKSQGPDVGCTCLYAVAVVGGEQLRAHSDKLAKRDASMMLLRNGVQISMRVLRVASSRSRLSFQTAQPSKRCTPRRSSSSSSSPRLLTTTSKPSAMRVKYITPDVSRSYTAKNLQC